MPIVANAPIKKLPEAILLVINFFDTHDNMRVENIDVSGYLFYKYRGTLFVRRGVSNTFMRNEKSILKNYIEYIINYLSNENKIAWTRTVIALEISVAVKTKEGEPFVVVIEVSNEKIDDWGNLRIRPLLYNKEEKIEKTQKRSVSYKEMDYISEIDELVFEEDLRKITSIDLFNILTPKDLNDLIERLKRIGVAAIVKEEEE